MYPGDGIFYYVEYNNETTEIFGRGDGGTVIYAICTCYRCLFTRYTCAVYTKQNWRLSFDFECQSHNFAMNPYKSLLIEADFRGG